MSKVVVRASGQLFENAERAFGDMSKAASAVDVQRSAFDTSATGGNGIAGIAEAHQLFADKETSVNRFYFGSWWDEHDQAAASFWQRVANLHNDEAENSTITELDQLRDEYYVRTRPVPLPNEFSQSAGTSHFSFAELNTGQYSWAVLTRRLLSQLEMVRTLAQLPQFRGLARGFPGT